MTRWQADENGMMRLFRLHETRMSDAAFEHTRQRVMRRARRLRWQRRTADAWRLATANAWDIVFIVAVLIWFVAR